MEFILNNWEVILSVIFAILVAFKVVLTAQQKQAITVLWEAIKEVIESFDDKTDKKTITKKAIEKINTEPKLNKIAQKIDSTEGFNTSEVVGIMIDNYSTIKPIFKGAWKILKGVKKIF